MGVTFFSIPRAFEGHIGLIQRNAIASWARLPDAEVILFGEEDGVGEVARQLGVRHEPVIARNALGTPLVSDAFARARTLASQPYVACVNADIVFTGDVVQAVDALDSAPFPMWVMVGQRRDLDVREPIEATSAWERTLLDEVHVRGSLHGKSGIDFFVFPKQLPIELPPLAVGRVGWDSWLIYAIRQARIPLVDATRAVCAVHQNHPPRHDPYGAEAALNRESAGGYHRMGSIRDADWQLIAEPGGRVRLTRRTVGRLWFAPPVRACLALKRAITDRLIIARRGRPVESQ